MDDRKKKLDLIIRNNPQNITVIMETAKAIGNVPEEDIMDYIISSQEEIESLSTEELVSITLDKFKGYRKTDIEIDHTVPKIIEQHLNSKELEEILTEVLSNPDTMHEHNSVALDGTPLAANIYKTRLIIGFITNYIIVHQEDYDMKIVYESLKIKDLNGMTEEELNDFFNKIIAQSVEKKLGISAETLEGKHQIAEYVYKNFIENGYCYQGTNSQFRKSIEQNGLTAEFSKKTDSDLIIIDEIFRRHGVDKIFFSKLSETKVSPYYYTTDGMDSAYHFSYHNPEYFAYFVASGNYMPSDKYNRAAYYLRDRDGCRNNIEILCDHYKLTEEERRVVLDTFERLSEIFITDQPNSVTIVSRKLLNKDKLPYDFTTISTRSIESIIGEITQNREGSAGTKQNIPIPADKIDVISVPLLSIFYYFLKVQTADKRKYIVLADGTKYYYDILINADKINYDCISIADGPPTLQTFISRDSKHKSEGTIDVIYCPQNIGPNDLLTNGSNSFQSLQMMIAVNGKGNSEKGIELIEQARKNYPPEYMSNFYYHLCAMCSNIAKDESVGIMTRCQAIMRMAKDFFPKAELMRVSGEYPSIVSADAYAYQYLSYYDHMQLKSVEKIKNGEIRDYETTVFDYLSTMYEKKLEGKIDPNFTEEFIAKSEELGILDFLQMIKGKNDEIEESQYIVENLTSEDQIESEEKFDHSKSSESELSSMFEETASTEPTMNSEKNKVYEKVAQSSESNSDAGQINVISIIVGMLITIVTLIYLVIKK